MKRREDQSPIWIKIKNLGLKKRYVVLLVVLALLFRFWGESRITMLQKQVPINTATEISLGEVYNYIKTKPQYVAENITIAPDLINNDNFEKTLNEDIHEWFLVREWRPTRFFYVEDRIKLIISCIQNQNAQLDEADRLEEEAQYLIKTTGHFSDPSFNKSPQAANMIKRARDLRYYIKKEIRQKGISVMEEKNIRNNLDDLLPLIEK